MQIPQLAKNMLKYLLVWAVLAAMMLGLFIGKDLYAASLGSPSKTPAQLPTGPNNPQPLMIWGAVDLCGSSAIYTSLPPKCKTFDGEFIPIPGISNVFVMPQGK